jgi:hypothetical protein
VGEDCNKGINNLNGVFSGVTRTTGGQKRSRTRTLYNIIVQGDAHTGTLAELALWLRFSLPILNTTVKNREEI